MHGWYARVWRLLAGADGPRRSGLPIAELLAPLPLVCLALLVLNDWVLKPSADAPRWLTGKLSDVAGLAVFPLVVTAAIDLVLAAVARVGAPVDASLRRGKLAAACLATAVVFTAMKLSPWLADQLSALSTALVRPSRIVPDPTDLVALPAIALAWWHGRRAIALGSYGRLQLARAAHARGRPLASPYGDAAACGAPSAQVATLDVATRQWLDTGDDVPLARALDALRGDFARPAA